MEVKIGVQYGGRELVLDSAQTPQEVEQIVKAAITNPESGSVLELSDEKGRTVMVPVDKLAYVEIGEPHRPVGFVAG